MNKNALTILGLVFLIITGYFPEKLNAQNPGKNNKTLSSVHNEQFQLKTDSAVLTRAGNWPFGSALAVAVDTLRHLVYLGSGGAVLVLDVSNISNPQLLSDKINSTGLVKALRYDHSTQHLYIAAQYEDFQIWDVQDPSSPQKLCQYRFPDRYAHPPVRNVDFYQHFAILECSYDYISSHDISDPTNPIFIDVSGYVGNPAEDIHVATDGRLHAVGAHYYVKYYIDSNGYLIPIADRYFTYGADNVFGTPEAAFVGAQGYLHILNSSGYILSTIDVGYFNDIYVQDDFAYITISNELRIFDVSNLENPFQVGSFTFQSPGYPNKLEVIGQYAYVAGQFAGLRIIDISDPTQPSEAGFYETFSTTTNLYRAGNYAYIAEHDDGILVLDINYLSDPTLVGQYNTPGIACEVTGDGNYLYVADGDSGLRIADITDPIHPVETGVISFSYVWRVAVLGNYAYIVDNIINQPDWIRVIDISNPADPTEVGSILMQSDIDGLAVSGNYLYAAADDLGMRVVDISNPNNPVEVGGFTALNVYDVCVQGDYAYLASADWDGGFIILDISEPTNPVFVSNYSRGGWLHPFDVAVEDDWVYVGAPTNDEIILLYIGDPAVPRELGTFTLSGDILDLFALDSIVYVSDGIAGLTILENELFSTPGGGISWYPQNSGTDDDLWSVYFINLSTGWAAGNNGTIIGTDDGGENWQSQTSGTMSELFTIFFINETTGWAVGREGTIIKTTNGGNNWQPQTSGTDNVLRSICFVDSVTGWTVGEAGTILYTLNGGADWQPQTSGTNEYLTDVYFIDQLHGWVSVSDNSGIILKTTNGGNSWQTVYTPTQNYFNSIYFINESTGWVAGTEAVVYKTTDSGNTWFEQYRDPITPYTQLSSIYLLDINTGWAVGHEGKIIYTSDGGDNWISQISGVQVYLTSVCFKDQYHGWAVGKEGTILKAISPTSVEKNQTSPTNIPANFILYHNKPNPFKQNTTIQYGLPKTSKVTLKIYNTLGEVIKTLVKGIQSSGFKSLVWDGTDNQGRKVSSGIYLCRIQIENSTETKKLMLLR